jgi:hypothetical protein
VDKASERVEVKLTWVGGHEQRQVLVRPVSSYEQHSDYPRVVALLRELTAQGLERWQIADRLNAAGLHPPKQAKRFNKKIVYRLMVQLGLPRRARAGSRVGLQADEWRVCDLARHLGVRRDTLERWVQVGWVHAYRDADDYWVLWADVDEVARLRALHALPRTLANKKRLAELRKPKKLPKRPRTARRRSPSSH